MTLLKRLRYLLALITVVSSAAALWAQSCSVAEHNTDYSVENGSANSVTVTANVNAIGDFVGIAAWCFQGCTPVSVTMGGQTAVKTTVSGISDAGTGQVFIYYVLSAAAAGAQTITWTVSGAHTGIQASYVDFTPSAGCTYAHNVDSSRGSGTGQAINTPSITPTAGDLLFGFTAISQHVTSVNAPWSCATFSGFGETQTCFAVNTFNTIAYILSAASGATANNLTNLDPGDTWQALISSFTLSAGAGQTATPTFSPGAGNYASSQTVTITSATAGATICYTTNGSTPTGNGAGTCTAGTTLTNGSTIAVSVAETVKAIGTKSGLTDSAVGAAAYNSAPSPPTNLTGVVH
jgi:Chitobiase/beta-hexosaminidase C-terminal domain